MVTDNAAEEMLGDVMTRNIDGTFTIETNNAAEVVLRYVLTRNINGTFTIETDDAADIWCGERL